MKMWLYGPIVVLVTLLSGCEAAGVGDEVDGRTDLQAGAVSLTGTVATQVDLNSFSAIEFDYPSEAVFFFLIDSGGSGAAANYATSASTDYSFELTIPVPEDRSLQLPPEGISSRDPEARILSLDLYGAREDALVYGESDILAYGRIDGVRGRQETVRATTLRYIYSDRPTILHGEDAETGMVADALSLESGWNEVLQISAFEYDRDATLVGSSQTLINGSPPERSNWFLLGNYLPARIESRKLSRSQQVQDAATFIAFDSANPESQELFVRATVGESIELSTPGRTDITGRQVLLYFMLKDSDNADGTIENSTTRDTPDYVRGSDGGTDLLEVFMLIYSDQRNPALMAGTRNAEEAATPDGTPVDNYLQIGNAALAYDNAQEHSFRWTLSTRAGEITGTFTTSELETHDFEDFRF